MSFITAARRSRQIVDLGIEVDRDPDHDQRRMDRIGRVLHLLQHIGLGFDLVFVANSLGRARPVEFCSALAAETGMANLCLAGGVALNCVANGKVLREGKFKRIWIQPAAGDAGGALGVSS